jgi:hypothetical protein
MRSFVLFLTLALVAPAHAEESRFELEEQIDGARAQLGGGIALTAVGLLLGVTAGGLLATDHGPSEPVAHKGALGLGISAAVLGVIGIPLVVIGARRLRTLKKRQLALGLSSLKLSF